MNAKLGAFLVMSGGVFLFGVSCVGVLDAGRTPRADSGPGLWLALLISPGAGRTGILAPGRPADLDGDGSIDGTLVDRDGDGRADGLDWDGDGQADANLPDSDGDGAPDGLDQNGDGVVDYWFCLSGETLTLQLSANCSGTAVRLIDTNGDGAPDGVDVNGDAQIDDALLGQIQADGTPPAALSDTAGGTYASALNVQITCTDNLAPGTIGYTLHGADVDFSAGVGVFGPPPALSVLVGAAGDGAYLLKYACRDARGNQSGQSSALYVRDSNAPNITLTAGPAAFVSAASGARNSTLTEWTSSRNGAFTVRRNAGDCTSGDLMSSGSIAAGAPESFAIQASVDFSGAGSQSFTICVTDALNGLVGSRSFVVARDDTPPTATLYAPASAGPWSSGVVLDLGCADSGGAGCAASAYSTNGVQPAFDANCTVTAGTSYAVGAVLPDGAYTLRVRACDAAGNESTLVTQNLSVGSSSSVKRIFLTAASFGGNLGGLTGANALCTADANNPNGGTYKALLSGNSAVAANQSYVRADGVTEIGASNGSGVLATPLTNAVGAGAAVWTGFGTSNCGNWTSSSGTLVFGSTGDPTSLNSAWLNSSSALCNSARRLYCVEQ